MKMSDTNQTGKVGGGNSDQDNDEMNSTTDANSIVRNLNVDVALEGVDEFISPRTRILEAKSSEEEITITSSHVSSRRKWIEETLLKDAKKPLSENTRKLLSRHSLPANASALSQRTVNDTAQSRSSLGESGDDVLIRARQAIEGRKGRKNSREVAKAKVNADLASIGGESSLSSAGRSGSLNGAVTDEGKAKGVSTSHATPTSLLKDNSKVNDASDDTVPSLNGDTKVKEVIDTPTKLRVESDKQNDVSEDGKQSSSDEAMKARANEVRAKAKERLSATMALLAGNSEAATPNTKLKNAIKRTQVKLNMQNIKAGDELVKDDEKPPPDPQRQNSAQVEAKRLEKDRLAAESANQADLERLEKERIEQERILEKQRQKEEEARRMADVQAKAERLKQERLAAEAAKQVDLKRRIEQEQEMAKQRKKEEKAKRLEAERLAEEDEVASHALERLEDERIKQGVEEVTSKDYDDLSQQSMSFGPIVNHSSSCSSDTPILDKPSGASSADSLGQVDRLLYQGKINDLPGDDSDDGDFEEAMTNSFNESGSQSIEMSNANENTEPSTEPEMSPGPMWKKAAEEAAYTTRLANDFLPRDAPVVAGEDELDPSPSMEPNQANLTSKKLLPEDPSSSNENNYDYHEEEHNGWLQEAEMAEPDEPTEWKGFQRQRMIYMAALGTVLGFFLSLYVQTTCHFITGEAAVGEDEVEFSLYYGLNKFTPIDSAFQGYNYCQPYNSKYSYSPPTIPRVFGVAATLFGTIPLIVIGVYLRFTMTHKILWIGSMWLLYIGFVSQISTFSIFLLDLCQDGINCSMGPGAWAAGISAIVWFLLAVEMKLNSPLVQPLQSDDGIVVIEKESLIISVWRKINGGSRKAPSLSRTAMKKQKGRIRKGEKEMVSYRPPEIV